MDKTGSQGAVDDESYDVGHVLVLLTDRNDMGEQRFSDVGRNLLVASTNQDRFAKKAIEKVDTTKKGKKKHAHYSESESEIVGEYGVYKDTLVMTETVRLVVTHSFA